MSISACWLWRVLGFQGVLQKSHHLLLSESEPLFLIVCTLYSNRFFLGSTFCSNLHSLEQKHIVFLLLFLRWSDDVCVLLFGHNFVRVFKAAAAAVCLSVCWHVALLSHESSLEAGLRSGCGAPTFPNTRTRTHAHSLFGVEHISEDLCSWVWFSDLLQILWDRVVVTFLPSFLSSSPPSFPPSFYTHVCSSFLPYLLMSVFLSLPSLYLFLHFLYAMIKLEINIITSLPSLCLTSLPLFLPSLFTNVCPSFLPSFINSFLTYVCRCFLPFIFPSFLPNVWPSDLASFITSFLLFLLISVLPFFLRSFVLPSFLMSVIHSKFLPSFPVTWSGAVSSFRF